jgi:outer membrane immunogenic protein
MKHLLLATTALAVAIASQASAADLGTAAPAYTKAPAYARVSNWSGFYIGGNVGYGWGNGNTDILPSHDNAILFHTSLDGNPKGVFGGAQLGYNWQLSSIVAGLEADIQGSGIRGSSKATSLADSSTILSPGTLDTASTNSELSWFGTIRGRLGVTVTPDLLLYGTGGLAYGQIKNSANVQIADPPFNDSWPASISNTKTGWAAGAGAEWMFARNWSAKIEYLHIDLGNSSATATDVVSSGGPFTDTTKYNWKNQYDTVRAGVNYHF